MTEYEDPYPPSVRTGDRFLSLREHLAAKRAADRLAEVHVPALAVLIEPDRLPGTALKLWDEVEDSLCTLRESTEVLGAVRAADLLNVSRRHRSSVNRVVSHRERRLWIHGVPGIFLVLGTTACGQVITHGQYMCIVAPVVSAPGMYLIYSAVYHFWNVVLDLYRCQHRISETISRLNVLIDRPRPLA